MPQNGLSIGAKRMLIAIGVLVALPIVVRVATQPLLYADAANVPKADAIMILGASASGKGLSPILRARVDAAVTLYENHVSSRILVSGDHENATYDEVTPVVKYLSENGIPLAAIFVDDYGLDTFSSMYRARWVFGARSLVVVSQDYHLPRAIMLGHSFGLDIRGFVSDGGDQYFGYIREMGAQWKACWDVMMGREAKYVGAPVPLWGRGNASL